MTDRSELSAGTKVFAGYDKHDPDEFLRDRSCFEPRPITETNPYTKGLTLNSNDSLATRMDSTARCLTDIRTFVLGTN